VVRVWINDASLVAVGHSPSPARTLGDLTA
jgi:hypothetical protein